MTTGCFETLLPLDMKTIPRMAALCLFSGFLAFPTRAGEMAVVQENRVNVRGRPTLNSEVITQLKQGEKVEILEEIATDKPKSGEPAHWYRINMPANTPVWVFADFIDATNKTVKPARLNVRAGPGENFSSVGRLLKDATVKEIRVENGWMEIEMPEKCYAFIATDMVSKEKPAAAPEPAPVAETKPPETKPVVTKPVETPKPEPAPAPEPPPVKVEKLEPVPAPPVAQPVTADPAPAPAPAPAPVPTAPATPPPAATPAPEPPAPAPTEVVVPPPSAPKKRIVTREGVVSRNYSLQSPTHYGLEATDSGKVINYLFGEKIDVKLDAYKGRKVIVTGEEAIDKRWPKTPVLVLDSIRLAP